MATKPLVFLDPGHGAINPRTAKYVTPGKRAHHKGYTFHNGRHFYEAVFNRQFCKVLEAQLNEVGINTAWTVPKGALWLDTPLPDRVAYANSVAKAIGAPSLFLSIHANASPGANASGYELFTSPGNTSSDSFATSAGLYMGRYYSPYIGRLRADFRDGDLDKEARFTVLTETTMPACLAELGFMDFLEDALMLNLPEAQAMGARSFTLAALDFFN